MDNMEHLKFLQKVADSDVDVLKLKEETYQGSWKRSGGRSAWFMFKRNMDRLMVMLAPVPWPESFSLDDIRDCANGGPANERTFTNELAQWMVDKLCEEDVFAKIEEAPTGVDGTVLACLRDLRRYALLIEAEMVARGSIKPEKDLRPTASDIETAAVRATGKPLDVPHPTPAPRVIKGGTLTPWIVGAQWRKKHNMGNSEVRQGTFNEWWRWIALDKWHWIALDKWALEPAVKTSDDPPSEIADLYSSFPTPTPTGIEKWWILNLTLCPPDARQYFPEMQYEMNHKELSSIEPWMQTMYSWIENEGKYRLAECFDAWRRG